jgi:hypothetical protein
LDLFGAGPLGQQQKRGLKRIFGIMAFEHALADAQHHGPMPFEDHFKGSLVPSLNKRMKQLAIRVLGIRAPTQAVNMPEHGPEFNCRHVLFPLQGTSSSV